MNIEKIRRDFPALDKKQTKKTIVYFDTACQSLRPQAVIEAVNRYYQQEPACSGRSMHQWAAAVTREVDQARERIARFLNASRPQEIIFTRNTTEGINLVANTFPFQAGDVVLISDKEHNSNLIPWQMQVKRRGIVLKVIPTQPDNTFNMGAFDAMLDERVKLVALGFTSNLDGVTIPAAIIIKKAHEKGARVLLDAAQTAPHHPIDVRALDVDFLALSGHKMLGPSGTGVLYGKYALLESLPAFLVGGDTVANSTYTDCDFLPPPEKFEAGLQDYAGIIGLGAAVEYLQRIGFDAIRKQETLITQTLSEQLRDVPGLKIIGPEDPALRGGITTFYIENIDSHRVALMLDQMANILVRSGQHCVHSWFNSRQIKGAVRASAYFYNTLEEASLLADCIKKVRKVL